MFYVDFYGISIYDSQKVERIKSRLKEKEDASKCFFDDINCAFEAIISRAVSNTLYVIPAYSGRNVGNGNYIINCDLLLLDGKQYQKRISSAFYYICINDPQESIYLPLTVAEIRAGKVAVREAIEKDYANIVFFYNHLCISSWGKGNLSAHLQNAQSFIDLCKKSRETTNIEFMRTPLVDSRVLDNLATHFSEDLPDKEPVLSSDCG
jgi:hypothetical protein